MRIRLPKPIKAPKFDRSRPGVVAFLDLARTARSMGEAAHYQRLAAAASLA